LDQQPGMKSQSQLPHKKELTQKHVKNLRELLSTTSFITTTLIAGCFRGQPLKKLYEYRKRLPITFN